MSKLTYKVKHDRDFSIELSKALKIANFSLRNRNSLSSKYVKHIGLSAAISNQILRKYGKNKTCKKIHKIKLIVPGQSIQHKDNNLYISCLKLYIPFNKPVEKICQIELDNTYAYICCEIKDQDLINPVGFIGIDLNATGHIAVCSIDSKILKLGKKAHHTHEKYKSIRKTAQKQLKYNFIRKLKNRESRITKDLNHKISRKVVNLAKENNYGIKLEKLTGIRRKKQGKRLNAIKSNWSFYQLQKFIEYKAKLLGLTVNYIDPRFTSQKCSRCGLIGLRESKKFMCLSCRHVDHADANAAFNIAQSLTLGQLAVDRDAVNSQTDMAEVAMGIKRVINV